MGKSEQDSNRFRRKAKSAASLSTSREATSDPVVSTPKVGDLLCDSPAEMPSGLQESSSDAIGRCSPSELTNGDAVGVERCLSGEDSLESEDGPAPTADFDPVSSLPVDLAGLPRSDVTPLGSDGSLDLSACHVQDDAASILVIFVHNSSSSDIRQVLLELHSDELQVTFSLNKRNSTVQFVRLALINVMTFLPFIVTTISED